MPTYCFMCECGAKTSMFLPFSRAKERPNCPKCSKRLERDFPAEMLPQRHAESVWKDGLWSIGIHPDQIPDVQAKCRLHGVPVPNFDRQGNPIFSSQLHKNKYCKKFGY